MLYELKFYMNHIQSNIYEIDNNKLIIYTYIYIYNITSS